MTAPGARSFVPASRGGERRVRALVRFARHAVSFGLRYRLRELQLLAIPCGVAVVGAVLPPRGAGPDLRTDIAAAVVFCLLLLAANVVLTVTTPWADQHLWPVAALLLALQFALALTERVGGAALLTPAAVALALVVGTARVARPAVRLLAGRRPPRAGRWTGAAALLVGAAGALLVAVGSGDWGWGIVALATLLAPYYVWHGGGAACLIVAGLALLASQYPALSSDAASPPAVPAGATAGSAGESLAALDDVLVLPGLGAVIALYAALCTRGLRVALLQGDARAYLTAALVAALAAQGAVAVAAGLRLLPASRVPAPFLGDHPLAIALPALLLGLLLRLSSDAGGAERPDQSADSSGSGATRGAAAGRT
jgi:hypothetical protein